MQPLELLNISFVLVCFCNKYEVISLMSSLQWLVGTKPSHNPRHFPELKITFQNPKHFPESKTLPRIQKHFPESKNTWFWEVFWILGHVFGFCHVFLDSGNYFGFWKVFSRWAQKPLLKCLIKAKFTYLLHFFSFLDKACQIDYDCWPSDIKFLLDAKYQWVKWSF